MKQETVEKLFDLGKLEDGNVGLALDEQGVAERAWLKDSSRDDVWFWATEALDEWDMKYMLEKYNGNFVKALLDFTGLMDMSDDFVAYKITTNGLENLIVSDSVPQRIRLAIRIQEAKPGEFFFFGSPADHPRTGDFILIGYDSEGRLAMSEDGPSIELEKSGYQENKENLDNYYKLNSYEKSGWDSNYVSSGSVKNRD